MLPLLLLLLMIFCLPFFKSYMVDFFFIKHFFRAFSNLSSPHPLFCHYIPISFLRLSSFFSEVIIVASHNSSRYGSCYIYGYICRSSIRTVTLILTLFPFAYLPLVYVCVCLCALHIVILFFIIIILYIHFFPKQFSCALMSRCINAILFNAFYRTNSLYNM